MAYNTLKHSSTGSRQRSRRMILLPVKPQHTLDTTDYSVVKVGSPHEGGVLGIGTVNGIVLLTTRSWNTPTKLTGRYELEYKGLYVNGFLYWLTSTISSRVILALDVKHMVFSEIQNPCPPSWTWFLMGTLKGCLCLICHSPQYDELWVMNEHSVCKSWSKVSKLTSLFTDNYLKSWCRCILDEGKLVLLKNTNEFIIYDMLTDSYTKVNKILTTCLALEGFEAREYVESCKPTPPESPGYFPSVGVDSGILYARREPLHDKWCHKKTLCEDTRWHSLQQRRENSQEIQSVLASSPEVHEAVEIGKKIKLPDLHKNPDNDDSGILYARREPLHDKWCHKKTLCEDTRWHSLQQRRENSQEIQSVLASSPEVHEAVEIGKENQTSGPA
ncbi:F-box domain-containing protein [Artemisia annua]|uniref:F-box domain-containing protein n=1 Tax=Artemisia annua TaxID=35608 RepID=A0A2U1PD44_ARTAN|nr:F-box domain-containing protein [Artemisia annua]